MDERLKFIARLLDGQKMAELCREFGVSRKTGYKILNRYNTCGLQGLTDRSRRPYRQANQLPFQVETLIVRLKQDKPSWGAPKIRGKDWLGSIRMCTRRRSARCTRCSIVMAWSNADRDGATRQREPRSPVRSSPMTCGVPITRASSCLAIGVIATADHQRLCQPLSDRLRSSLQHQGRLCLLGV